MRRARGLAVLGLTLLTTGCGPAVAGAILASSSSGGSSGGGGGGNGAGPWTAQALELEPAAGPATSATWVDVTLTALPAALDPDDVRVRVGSTDLLPGDEFFFNTTLTQPPRHSLSLLIPPSPDGNRSGPVRIRVSGAVVVSGIPDFERVLVPMQVVAIDPSSGPMAGGTTVRISGAGFGAGMQVRVGGTAAAVQSVSTGEVVVQTPPSATWGTKTVEVEHPEGPLDDGATFYYTHAPEVSVTAPSSGASISGTTQVSWTTTDDDPSTVELRLSSDAGATFPTVIVSGLADTGSYAWDTTATADGTTYRVRVIATDVGELTGSGSSAGDFTVDNTPGPLVVGARYEDANSNATVDAGDLLFVVFDEAVRVQSATAAAFVLPVTGDRLGTGATVATAPQANEVKVTLGSSPVLTGAGAFSASNLAPGAPSGIDVSATLAANTIESMATNVDAAASTPADVKRAGFTHSQSLSSSVYNNRLADLDGDGDLDLAETGFGTGAKLWENIGGTLVFRQDLEPGANSYSLLLVDVDGDGDRDVVVSGYRVFLNQGAWSFTPTSGIGSNGAIEAGDFDGDGDIDIVGNNGGDALNLYRNDGTGVFSVTLIANRYTESLGVGDLDGDGDLDVVRSASQDPLPLTTNRRLERFFNDGAGNFGSPVTLVVDDSIVDLDVGDLEGDGDLDVVAISSNGNIGGIRRLVNAGDGTFTQIATLTDRGGSSVIFADFDSDGDQDLISSLAVWVNDGVGGFRETNRILFAVPGTYTACAGDLDGDGDVDLVTGHYVDADSRVYLSTLIGD